MSTTIHSADHLPPPEESLPHKSSNTLLWLLLLLALLVALWVLYDRGASLAPFATTTPTTSIDETPLPAAQIESGKSEIASTSQANQSARTERSERRRAGTAKPRIANRSPEPIARLQPAYPPAAYRNGDEGSVLVRADIDANGVPVDVNLARRSGSRDLDRAALDAVRHWRFRPAIENGKAVASTVQVPIDFRLAEQ